MKVPVMWLKKINSIEGHIRQTTKKVVGAMRAMGAKNVKESIIS